LKITVAGERKWQEWSGIFIPVKSSVGKVGYFGIDHGAFNATWSVFSQYPADK